MGNNIKLSVSNIAWPNKSLKLALQCLSHNNFNGVELSLNKIFREPVETPQKKFAEIRNIIENFGLQIVATHSLFYTMKKYNIFSHDGFNKLLNYLIKISEIMEFLGTSKIIFGSGTCRNNELSKKESDKVFKKFLEMFLKKTSKHKTQILIEPLAKNETNYINNCSEAIDIIKNIDTERVQLHIDLKSSIQEKENLKNVFNDFNTNIKHIHISDKDLRAPSKDSGYHENMSSILKENRYSHYVSVEMKEMIPFSEEKFDQILRYTYETYKKQ